MAESGDIRAGGAYSEITVKDSTGAGIASAHRSLQAFARGANQSIGIGGNVNVAGVAGFQMDWVGGMAAKFMPHLRLFHAATEAMAVGIRVAEGEFTNLFRTMASGGPMTDQLRDQLHGLLTELKAIPVAGAGVMLGDALAGYSKAVSELAGKTREWKQFRDAAAEMESTLHEFDRIGQRAGMNELERTLDDIANKALKAQLHVLKLAESNSELYPTAAHAAALIGVDELQLEAAAKSADARKKLDEQIRELNRQQDAGWRAGDALKESVMTVDEKMAERLAQAEKLNAQGFLPDWALDRMKSASDGAQSFAELGWWGQFSGERAGQSGPSSFGKLTSVAEAQLGELKTISKAVETGWVFG
jgi:hypothetical protein